MMRQMPNPVTIGRSTERRGPQDALLKRGGVHLLDFRARDRSLAVADAEHLGDGRRGDLVIAGVPKESVCTDDRRPKEPREPNASPFLAFERLDK